MTFLALPDHRFLPAPPWVLTTLHVVTLLLHLLAMNCLLGGVVAVLFAPYADRWNHPVVRRTLRLLPTLVAATVTLGVAPLLFVQLVYGRVVYSASIVSGWFWLAIPAAVMLAYAFLYAASFARPGRGRTRGYLLVALVALLFVSVVYSSVFSLAEDPSGQASLYRETQTGLAFNPDVGAWLVRWLHMLTGALTVGGFLLAALGRSDEGGWRVGRTLFLGGMLLAAATGVAYLLTLGDDLKGFMRSAGIWWLTVAVVLAAGSLHFFVKRRLLPAGVLLVASVLGMVVSRHVLRDLRLEGHFDAAATRVDPQWGVFLAFLAFFVLALGAVAWMLRLFFRPRAT